MWLGIDVGGTFTDAVVIAAGKVVYTTKIPTTHENLLQGILMAIDEVIKNVGSMDFERICLSTTIVTNALVEGKSDSVGLIIMPGPGMDIESFLPVKPYILPGYIDHRGREVTFPVNQDMQGIYHYFPGYDIFAVSGKFSVRNPEHEIAVGEWLAKVVKPEHITLGSSVAGTLNFLRRTNSAYYNAAVWRQFNNFANAVESALNERGIAAPVYILKADGGTMPLMAARDYPVEAIFTGPAASVLGIKAMTNIDANSVSLDIGGTTTDIALWTNGVPLFAERGAVVDGFPTAVRAFWLKSVGIGGDSAVYRDAGLIKVGPMRHGSAMAIGGPKPTLSDAMIVAGLSNFGIKEKAVEAMEQIALADESPFEAAKMVLKEAADTICQAIEEMLDEQAAEPVYSVKDILHSSRLELKEVIGVGGAAAGLVPIVAKQMDLAYKLPIKGMVANAIGAAVSKPTVDITLRVDTEEGYYSIAELGIKEQIKIKAFSLSDAYELAEKHLSERAKQNGIIIDDTEIIQSEEFNIVRGFNTVGKIIMCRLQVKPGVLTQIEED